MMKEDLVPDQSTRLSFSAPILPRHGEHGNHRYRLAHSYDPFSDFPLVIARFVWRSSMCLVDSVGVYGIASPAGRQTTSTA